MREGVRHTGQLAVQQSTDALLVHRVHDRPQQAHTDRFDFLFPQPLDDHAHPIFVERRDHLPVRPDALGHLEGQGARHVGLGVRHRVVEGGDTHAPGFAQHQDVGMAPGGEKRGAGGRTGEHRIGRDSGAVHEQLDATEQGIDLEALVTPGQRDRREHPFHRVVGGGRRLVHAQPTLVVFDDQVGEGASGIDGKTHRGTRSRLERNECTTAFWVIPRCGGSPIRSMRPTRRTSPAGGGGRRDPARRDRLRRG